MIQMTLTYAEPLRQRCKTELENVYRNGGKACVVGLFHSNFIEKLLDEFLDESDIQKFVENSKTKTIKENVRNKDNVRN